MAYTATFRTSHTIPVWHTAGYDRNARIYPYHPSQIRIGHWVRIADQASITTPTLGTNHPAALTSPSWTVLHNRAATSATTYMPNLPMHARQFGLVEFVGKLVADVVYVSEQLQDWARLAFARLRVHVHALNHFAIERFTRFAGWAHVTYEPLDCKARHFNQFKTVLFLLGHRSQSGSRPRLSASHRGIIRQSSS